jgi:putative transposase
MSETATAPNYETLTAEALVERLIGERGCPENVRSDNGPEFTSRRMLAWSQNWKVGLVHIQQGRPMQNGHMESFHGRLRDECLNVSWFRTLNDVRSTLARWQREYNCERPHSSLDYRTPEEFRLKAGYADVESRERFPHPHSLGGDGCEIISKQTQNRETPVISG